MTDTFSCDCGTDDPEEAGLEFSNGTVGFNAYSYHIDSWGVAELTKQQTYELYKAMKVYYGDAND